MSVAGYILTKEGSGGSLTGKIYKSTDATTVSSTWSEVFEISDNYKIYWMGSPIAYISPGKNYLNPKLELVVDEAIDTESKEKLKINLEEKLKKLIKSELSDLVNLSESKFKNRRKNSSFETK